MARRSKKTPATIPVAAEQPELTPAGSAPQSGTPAEAPKTTENAPLTRSETGCINPECAESAKNGPRSAPRRFDHLRIVVYAIARQEAVFARRWMASMKEADEVCVIDTGSTDGTDKILRDLGAHVRVDHYDPWRTIEEYDAIKARGGRPWRFDVARNDSIFFALSVAPDADVLVCTDLDEILLPGWRAKLEEKWLEALNAGKRPTTGRYEYVWNFKPDGSDGVKFAYEKIHAPTVDANGVRWEHPVHEVLGYNGSAKVYVDVPIRLEHHADPKKSRGQYLNLLALSVRECPEDDRNAHYYGRELMFWGRYEEAVAQLKRHLELKTATWKTERSQSMRFIARCLRAVGRRDESYEWFRRAVEEAPGRREAAVEMEFAAYKDCRWDDVVWAGTAALAVTRRAMDYTTEAESWGALPHDLISIGLYHKGRYGEALEQCRIAISKDPNDQRIKANLACIQAKMPR